VLADAGRRISVWFRYTGTIAVQGQIFYALTSGSLTVWDVVLLTNGKLRIEVPGAAVATGTAVLAADTWYRVSWDYTITDTTHFRIDQYVNGVADVSDVDSGTMSRTGSDIFRLNAQSSLGANVDVWFDNIYLDDGVPADGDPGDVRVTAKRPNAENTTGFDTAVGNARGASDYNSVNEVPISETNGWEHRGVAWVANGSLATNATTASMAITAPSLSVNDIMIAFIYGNNNQVVSPPDGTWTSVCEVNNTANMRSSVFWKRAAAADSGGSFTFTKPIDDNLLFAGFIGSWKGARTSATPIDATACSSSPNASSDTVTYATFDPTETNAFVIAAGFYANDLTTAGAFSGTDPTMTNRADLETSTGADASIFVFDGVSSGAATGSRTHSTTSTADAINQGFLFGLVPQAQENYTLESVSQGDVNITGYTVLGRAAWVWAKASATTGSPTAGIVDDGSVSAITLTTSSALYTVRTLSASYPSNAAGIGMRSTGTVNDTFFYEGGTLIAYLQPVVTCVPSLTLLGVGRCG
jgi:hypothetical protein